MSRDCFYRVNSPGIHERSERLKPFDLSLTSCDGQKRRTSEFIDEFSDVVNLHGCSSLLDLLNMRANGETVNSENETEVGSRVICLTHFQTLISEAKLRQTRSKNANAVVKCPLEHKKPNNADDRRIVDREMCVGWLEMEGEFVPPGTTICTTHQGKMKKLNGKFRKKTEKQTDPSTAPIDECDDIESMLGDCEITDNHEPPKPAKVVRKLPPEIIAAAKQLVKAMGLDRFMTEGEWDLLLEPTKKKKGYLAKRIFDIICEVITPDGKDDLYARATAQTRPQTEAKLAARLFDRIDERYAAATSTQEKVELLSLVSDLGLTMNEVIRCVPSATLHYLNLAKTNNKGGIDFEKKYRRESYDEKKSDRYVEFLARSNVLVSLAWGDTLTTLSDGTKIPIASVARKFSFSRIHRLYLRDLEATNELHLKLGRGSTTRILKVLAKRQNERMSCVDEFLVDAYDGWKRLIAVIEELRELHGLISDGEERAMKRWIRVCRSHLEGEYLSEICESSNVPQHCSRFALSDPSRKCFCMDCDHEHDGVCVNCDQLDLLLSTLQSLTDRLAQEATTAHSTKCHRIHRLHEITQFSCLNIRSFQAHLLRTALSNSGRAQIMERLQDGEALITLDFAMKILPLKAVEPQSDFFGKKGISLHISHAMAKINGELVDHTFAHTLDDTKQDTALVYSIIRHTLGVLETKGIHKVYLRSDNAGTYKSSSLIAALYHLSSPTMQIAGYYFSESQSGKGSCDRACAHCKRKMGEWIRAENNIENAKNIFQALTVENEIIRGLSTYYCTFTEIPEKKTNVFPGISQFFSFDFEQEGVRVRCQYGIGEGKVTNKDKLLTLDCSLVVEEEGGHQGDSFWSKLDSSEKGVSESEEEEADEYNDDMFHCSTIGCLRSFRSTRWLIEHEIKGNHEFGVKKRTMTDKAVAKFNELIETRETARIAVSEQVEAAAENDDRIEHEMGWSLKSSYTTAKLDKEAKKRAEEYFNAQRKLNPPRRAEASFMRKQLEEALDPTDVTGCRYLLPYSRIPSEKQLTSLFSRLERKRNRPPKIKPSTAKIARTTKLAETTSKSTRSKSSVRTPKGGTRKRRVVKESESEESVSEEEEEDEDEEEDQIVGMHEEDYAKKAIVEGLQDIFL